MHSFHYQRSSPPHCPIEGLESDMQLRLRQYKRKISQWNLDKNVKDTEMMFIMHKQKRRKVEGKDTDFIVRGRPVEPEKITRTMKRKNISENDLLLQPSSVAGKHLSSIAPEFF